MGEVGGRCKMFVRNCKMFRNLGGFLQNVLEIGSNLAIFSHFWPLFVRFLTIFSPISHIWGGIGGFLAKIGTIFANMGEMCTKWT